MDTTPGEGMRRTSWFGYASLPEVLLRHTSVCCLAITELVFGLLLPALCLRMHWVLQPCARHVPFFGSCLALHPSFAAKAAVVGYMLIDEFVFSSQLAKPQVVSKHKFN